MNTIEKLRLVGQTDDDVVVVIGNDEIALLSMQGCRKIDREGKSPIYISTLRWADPVEGSKKCTVFGEAEGQRVSLGDTLVFTKATTGTYAGTYSARIERALA